MKNQTTFVRLVFALCLICSVTVLNAANYYISTTDGDDSRTALQAQNPSTPWKSIEKLNAVFSSLRAGDNVFFKKGDVFAGTIVPAASGTASAPIVLSAYGTGAAPVISGLRPLSGWVSTGGNVWEADASFAQSAVNVVLVNGVPQAIGRYPNSGAANGGYLTLESYSGNSSITDQQLSSLPNWTGGEVVIRKNRWVLDRNKITSHNGNTINYTSESGYYASNNYGYFIQNHRAALDQNGEWYFDNSTKKFGIYAGGAPSSVEAGAVSTLFSAVNQSNITVTGLVFKGANGNAIALSNVQNVQIINCEILYSGANALLALGCAGVRVEGCTITGTANSALELQNSPNAVIKANRIKRTGTVAGMGKGDSGSYEAVLIDGDNETIEGNEIDSTGYIPVTFRGNSNTIKNNFITNYNTVKDDGGGIYTWNNIAGAAPAYGSKITGNIILNGRGAGEGTDDVAYKAANGIYMDDNTAGVEISGNTVANCGLYALYVHNGYGLTITGNTFFNSSSQAVFAHDNYAPNAKVRNVTMQNNVFFAKEAWQLVAEFKTPDNDIASFGTFDNNYYCRPAYEAYIINTAVNSDTYNLDLAEWKAAFGKDASSRTFPVPAVSYDAIRLEYNASAASKTLSLDGIYTDAAGTTYNGSITLSPYSSSVLVKKAVASGLCPGTAGITREQWNNTPNGDLSAVPWQTTPSKKTTVTGAFEAGTIGDAYGSRLSGYLCPPQTGTYTFWIAGDDFAELWLSSDNNPANKRKIAAISGWTTLRDWNKAGSQKSASVTLQAGTRYYLEVVQKEGNGGDHVSVAWQLPGGEFEGPIPGYRFPSTAGTSLQSQSISFSALSNVVLGSGAITLSATASSGLPVTFSLVSGPAALSGNVLTPTAAGTVIVKASQSGNAQYGAAADVTQQLVITSGQTAQCSATGTILREQWNGIAGNDVAQIPVNTTPSAASQLTSFEGPKDIADQYGSRIRGYVCPPQSGNYVFWIAGDDATELWLSTSDDPSGKTKIAYNLSWTGFREWTWYASQKSATIYLEAGKKYYIEALQKEGGGGDHLSVKWQLPDGTTEAPIPGSRLSPFIAKTALLDQTISFEALQNFTLGNSPLILSASASSGLPVIFSLVSGSATLNGALLTPTAAGTVVVKASQAGNSQYAPAPDVTQSLTVSAATVAQCSATGTILREQWNEIAGNDVVQIPLNIAPSSASQLTSFEGPQDIAEAYGSRIRGYVCPPQSGNYTFWIAGDDATELWLSSDEAPSNKLKIAYSTQWTNFREWTKYGTQKSASVYLMAGRKYYIEALQKEGWGGDHLSVKWQLPDGTTEAPIPGSRLSPYTAATALLNQTISFGALQNFALGNLPLSLSATASSGLPVTFSLVSGPATLSGNVLTPTAAGTIIVRASQSGNAQYNAASDVTQSLTVVPIATRQCSASGTILREQWNGVNGNDVVQVPVNATPSSTSQLTSFEGPQNIADAYGSRIRGYVCPPQSGNYVFWIAGDDATELWLSTSDDPSGKTKIAYNLSWTYLHEWNKFASQKSAPMYLEAGRKYYIEALHKEGAGGDNLSAAWQLPDGTFEAPIAGSRLSPFTSTTSASASRSLQITQLSEEASVTEAGVKEQTPVFSAYPNPFSAGLTVDFAPAASGQCTLEIYNAVGVRQWVLFNGMLQKGNRQRFLYRPPSLPAGIYFVHCRSASGLSVYKLVKK